MKSVLSTILTIPAHATLCVDVQIVVLYMFVSSSAFRLAVSSFCIPIPASSLILLKPFGRSALHLRIELYF